MTQEDFEKSFPRLVGFSKMSPRERLAYVNTPCGEKWLNKVLDAEELDEVSRLVCHASIPGDRKEQPIIGDLPTRERTRQENFESELFGYSNPLDEENQ